MRLFLLIVLALTICSCQSIPPSTTSDTSRSSFNPTSDLPHYYDWYQSRDAYYEGVDTIQPSNEDPYEESNRTLFVALSDIDAVVLKAPTIAYREITTSDTRKAIQNFYFNLDEPRMAIYKFLMGDLLGFWSGLFRFVFNLTFGFLGFFDNAEHILGIEQNLVTFAGVLNFYGLPQGDYIAFGPLPMNELDAFGYLAGLTMSILVCGAVCSKLPEAATTLFLSYAILEPIVYRNYFLELEEKAEKMRLKSMDRYTFNRQFFLDYRKTQRNPEVDPFLDEE